MSNSCFNPVLPFTAAVNGYIRLLNALTGVIVIPLLILAGFSAIESDFERIRPAHPSTHGYTSQSAEYSVCTISRAGGIPVLDGSVIGNVWKKGMILFPLISGQQFIKYSSKGDCGKTNGAVFDSTIYISSDMVDKPPELIWMIYPDLSKADPADVFPIQVTLNILVDYTGKPLEVIIADETLMSHNARKIVLESAKTSVFKPAQKNNQSVRCWVQVPLELKVDA